MLYGKSNTSSGPSGHERRVRRHGTARRERCFPPPSVVETNSAIDGLEVGAVLEVLATGAGSTTDIDARDTGRPGVETDPPFADWQSVRRQYSIVVKIVGI
jgi:hypothetical protein